MRQNIKDALRSVCAALRVLHEEHAFSALFLKCVLSRSMRNQADLVDQLFNSIHGWLAELPVDQP
jgi:hypothetical protein